MPAITGGGWANPGGQYLPDDATPAAVAARARLLASTEGLAPDIEATRAFGHRLATEVEITPGTHAGYHDHPIEFAQALRRLLRKLAGQEAPQRASALSAVDIG